MNNDIKEFKKIRAEINERVDFCNMLLSINSLDKRLEFKKLFNSITKAALQTGIARLEMAKIVYNIIVMEDL